MHNVSHGPLSMQSFANLAYPFIFRYSCEIDQISNEDTASEEEALTNTIPTGMSKKEGARFCACEKPG